MGRPKKSAANVVVMPQPKASDRTVELPLEHALLSRFRRDAAIRQTTVPRLINDILTTIADDGLTNAVLADRPPFK